MADRFESRAALAGKIEWEGGTLPDALEYGLSAKDMPEGDEELITAWTALDDAWAEFKRRGQAVENLLPGMDEG